MEIDMRAAYVICKFCNDHISKIWGGSLGRDPGAASFTGTLWDGRESSDLSE